jgi:arabinan endo-1,5-alpha-L-arabinosidase
MVGRSKDPAGPFLDAKGVSMADGGFVNVLKGSPPMFSPGHSDVLQDRSGRWLMPYHFYDGREYWGTQWGLPTLQIRELLWSADGWPLPGLPLEMEFGPSTGKTQSPVGEWLHQADFGQVDTVDLRPDGTFLCTAHQGRGPKPEPSKGKWTAQGDKLRLEWSLADGLTAQDELQLAYGGKYYVGRNQNGIVIRGIRK